MLGYSHALPLQLLLAELSALPTGYRRAEVIRPFQCQRLPRLHLSKNFLPLFIL
nr:MAG TPA_asm: hypothetical protein [Caudoviricetes sp.]